MDWYLISVLIFIVFLAAFVFKDRRKFTRDSILLVRKTNRGKGLIIRLGTRFPRGLKLVGYISVATGFIASVAGLKLFLDLLVQAFTTTTPVPGIAVLGASPTPQPVILPGVILVPFWYWIISIALLVVVHEGFHAIFTARERVRIKSLGIGILAVIPMAFVEPDEKQLEKKGMWPQLMVFSAGSFANFLVVGLVILTIWLMMSPIANVFSTATVGFMGYGAKDVMTSEIEQVDNITISNPSDLLGLNLSGDGIITIKTSTGTYISRPGILREELDKPGDSVILMEDYPAFRSNLTGLITRVDGQDLDGLDDEGNLEEANVNNYVKNLSMILGKAGPGKQISVVTGNSTETREFSLVTTGKPYPEPYKPDAGTRIDLAIASVFPGYWEFSSQMDETKGSVDMALAGLVGRSVTIDWDYTQMKLNYWRWVRDNAPNQEVGSMAGVKASYWENEAAKYQRPGYIGIMGIPGEGGVASMADVKPELAEFEELILFVLGLLTFILLINFGVGLFNLLPAKPLDGGRMWDAVLKRYVPKHAKRIMRLVGWAVLVIVLLSFASAFVPFGALL